MFHVLLPRLVKLAPLLFVLSAISTECGRVATSSGDSRPTEAAALDQMRSALDGYHWRGRLDGSPQTLRQFLDLQSITVRDMRPVDQATVQVIFQATYKTHNSGVAFEAESLDFIGFNTKELGLHTSDLSWKFQRFDKSGWQMEKLPFAQ